jgi:flagellar protein FlgJ
MELNNIGTAYFDDYRLSLPAGGIYEYGQNRDPQAFETLLKKAQSSHNPETTAVSVRNPPIDKTDKLYEQCLELETFLIKTLIGGMRKTIQKSGLINEGFAGKMYEDMLYDEYAKAYAKNAGFGLAEQAYRELTGRRGEI